jgi:hypothetical protein
MRMIAFFMTSMLCTLTVRADELVFSYDGDILPHPETGWWDGNCHQTCVESLDDGHLVLTWTQFRVVNYGYIFATPDTTPPPSPPFWAEWRFRSIELLDDNPGCDGRFSIQYWDFFDWIDMFGDAVISSDWGTAILGLPPQQFRTFRFETADGGYGCFFVDGELFTCSGGDKGNGTNVIQMQGLGGCDGIVPTVNEWDYVRYGRITYGEQLVASVPPGGFLDARLHAPIDRFTVTFDEPNYVLVDEVTANVTSSLSPSVPSSLAVAAMQRRDNGPPDEVEIVLDRPIPFNATTRFTFDDGVAVNIVEFTFAPGDTDGDGDADLADFSYLANCFGPTSPCPLAGSKGETCGPCLALDSDANSTVNAVDYSAFVAAMNP